jgi:hypothetical protein
MQPHPRPPGVRRPWGASWSTACSWRATAAAPVRRRPPPLAQAAAAARATEVQQDSIDPASRRPKEVRQANADHLRSPPELPVFLFSYCRSWSWPSQTAPKPGFSCCWSWPWQRGHAPVRLLLLLVLVVAMSGRRRAATCRFTTS